MSKNFLPPKGFRDLLPKQMVIRNRVIDTLRKVFDSYGFQPLQTPTLEYADTLMGKYGEEADKLLYLFEDRGGRKVGLNYDLTVPTARVLSQYQDLPKPFKRYQIQPSYRAENTQRGRYRQFTQCDIDIIGNDTPLADAEILAVTSSCLMELGLPNFTIQLNSRPVLYRLMQQAGIPTDKWATTLQTVDKADKQPKEALDTELFRKLQIENLFTKKILPAMQAIEKGFVENQTTSDPFLDQTYRSALDMGVSARNLVFKPSIVRGLDYYTGPIYETIVEKPKIGSVTGGGRYDKLVEQLGGPNLPATGTTIGLDRICDVIEELDLWPELNSTAKVLVTIFSPSLQADSLKLANFLRGSGISTEVYLDAAQKLEKQLKYADKKGIPNVIILGEEELKKDVAVLKNLKTGNQEVLSRKQLLEALR